MASDGLEADLQVVALLTQQPNDLKMVYHYTTPAGLKGILENEEIYFTDSGFLNDSSEKKLVLQAFEEVLNEVSDKFESAFAGSLRQGYGDFENLCAAKTHYVFSASCNPDSLSMWNYYAKGNAFEGYNIGLNPFALVERLNLQNKGCFFGRVIYDKNEMKQKIKAVILNCNTLWNKYEAEEDRSRILAFIFESLIYLAIFYKKECFRHEDEYRFVISVPDNDSDGLEFRIIRGCLIPYISIQYRAEGHFTLIQSINISPLLKSDLYKLGVERLLLKLGYDTDKISIGTSAIPVRY